MTLNDTLGRTPLDDGVARRRDLYLKTHTSFTRQTFMPSTVFEPAIPASERRKNHAIDRAATAICDCHVIQRKFHMAWHDLRAGIAESVCLLTLCQLQTLWFLNGRVQTRILLNLEPDVCRKLKQKSKHNTANIAFLCSHSCNSFMCLPSSQSTRNSRRCILMLSFRSCLILILEVLQDCYQLKYVSIPHLARLVTCLASPKPSFSLFNHWLKNPPPGPHTQDGDRKWEYYKSWDQHSWFVFGKSMVKISYWMSDIVKRYVKFRQNFYLLRKLEKTRSKRRKSNVNQNLFFSDEKLHWYYFLYASTYHYSKRYCRWRK
jgi:hypothetical protein